MLASNIEVPPASALDNMTLVVDYTPDSSTVATSVIPGNKIDLTATAPVAVAGTTQQEIVQDIGSQLRLSSTADIIAPAGWVISYSTDGTTWTTTAPTTPTGWNAVTKVKAAGVLVSQGADSSGRQIASTDANAGQPTTGQFPTTTGATGDGWNVFFDDAGHVFNVWHHNGSGGANVSNSNQAIDCHLRTGESCGPSWPFKIVSLSTAPIFNMHTSEQSGGWFDTVDNEIWFPTIYTSNGVNQVGFGCIKAGDVSLVNKWCGGTPDSSFVSGGAAANVPSSGFSCGQSSWIYDCTGGLAQYNGRLFTWAVNTGDIVCVDIRENGGAGGPCSTGGLVDFGANLTNVRSGNYRWRPTVGEWDGRIYGSGGQNLKAVCIDAMTGAACTGWANPKAITKAAVHFSKLPTAQGGVAGACFSALGAGANGGFFQCFDSSGIDISSSVTSNFTTKYIATYVATYDAYSQNWETHGSRMYWGDANWQGMGKIYCWDFALDSWCRNWTASGIPDTNYQLTIDPTNPYCIWSNSNDGIIQTYDAYTGAAGNCAVPPPTAVFEAGVVVPRMACSSVDAIQGWRSFVLSTTSSYTSATLTVKNGGVAITGWTNISIPVDNTVDLSTLTIAESGQNPTFTVNFTGRTTNGDVSARITAVGGSPQLCLRPLAPLCPTGSIFTPGQLAATSSTVTADGSATAGSVITPLNQASATVNIDASTPASCVSSLSGTARDTASNAISGATVTLTDSAGVTLLYPSNYGNASLRGQPITAITDASGNYSFNYLTPGAYAVKFNDVSNAEVTSSVVTAGNAGTLANRTTTETTTAITSLLSKVSTITLATPGVIDGVYTVMPTLTKRFFPSTLAVGQVGSLIFTFTNAPGNPAKSGLGFVDTLPAGLVVDTNNNLMTTCPGGLIASQDPTLNPTAMSTTSNTVTVTGASMSVNVAKCDYSVAIKATAAGVYTNGAGNVVTTGFKKETLDTLVATTPTTSGAFLCDANMYHIRSKQLYRQSPNQSPALSYEVGPKLTTAVINAIGFNSLNGFIYGIVTTSGDGLTAGHLVRYGSDGVPISMGAITGSMTAGDLTAIRGGDTDDAGNLIVGKGSSSTSIYSINIATLVSTTITLSSAVTANDLAYSNGKIYAQYGDKFFKITKDAAPDYSWAATSVTVFSNTVSGDAIWSNGFGEVIVSPAGSSFSRTLYRTSNPSAVAGTADFTLMFPVPDNSDDGAMCHSSPKPTAFPDTTVGPLNTPQTKNVLTNDTTPLTASGTTSSLVPSTIRLCNPTTSQVPPNCMVAPGSTVTVANVGVYSVSNAGEITFTPETGYTGTPTPLAYQVADGNGNVGDSTYTPTITSTTPVAMNDVSSAAYDTNQTINILTNDYSGTLSNIDPTTVKICTTVTAASECNGTSLTVPNEGTYTVNANGTVTFDPLPTFKGTATPIKYVVSDGQQQQTSATITPTVDPPAAPVATPETKSVIPGGTVVFTTLTGTGALATSGVGLNTSLTCLITPASVPDTCDADGVVTVAGVGTYTLNTTTGVVTLVADSAATAGTKTALKYQVTDITGQKATSTLTPVVPPAPVAVNDTSTGAYDTNQTITVLTNDTAGSGATLVPTSVKLCSTTSTANTLCNLTTLTVANQGTYTVNADGTVTFDPLSSFTGVASPVKYVVADTTTQLTSATITPTVSMPAAPVATAQTKTVIPGGTVAFTTLTGTGGLATSGVGFDTSVTCLITPASVPDTCDADGVVVVAGVGTYTLDKSTGVVTLVADPAATAGTKTALKYQVTDITGQKATSTLTPVIPPAPVAVNDTSSGAYDTNQTITILTNDTATTPATIVATSVKLCATTATANALCDLTTLEVAGQGTYTVNANGTVTFDPLSSFTGVATAVKYVVADTNGRIDDATITPTVALPTPPVATAETKSVIPGGTVAFTTLTGTGGLATSGVGLNATVTCLFTPSTTTCDADGVVVVAGVGTYTLDKTTGVVTLVADPAAVAGTKAALTYQVTDTFGQKATSTLTPVIPAPPVANNDTSSGAYDTNQVISPFSNDTATTPATIVASSVKLCATTATANSSCDLTTLTVANQGTYTVNANGTVTFDPLPTFNGVATAIKYVIADTNGRIDDATITPTVALPPVPTATPQSKAVIPGGTVAFTTLTGSGGLASSPAGLNATVTCLFTPSTTTCDADGVVVVAGVGTYTLDKTTGVVTLVADPAATQGTKAALTYQVTDTFGQKATSTLTPTIPAAPVAVNDASSGAFDTNQVISPLVNDNVTSPAILEPTTLRLCITTSTANASCNLTTLTIADQGTYTVNANGTVTFDPLPTFTGPASPVKYVVTDSSGQVTNATITPTVALPNPPVATPESKAVIPGGTVAFTTLTGTGGLATAVAGFTNASTCLLTPSTTTCDPDGVVTVVGVGTYTLDTATGVVTLVADVAATEGTKAALSYRVTDTYGQTATSTLTPVIPAGPVGVNDTPTGAYDTNQVISPLSNETVTPPATFIPSTLKLCLTTSTANSSCDLMSLVVPNEGTYTVNPDGTVTFDPLPTFKGTATPVKYVVTETSSQQTSATITPTVSAPNGPIATPQTKSVNPGDTVSFTTLTGASGLASAVAGLNAGATCLYTPNTTTCDADGVVVVSGEGTYTLNTSTGVVTFAADPDATAGTKTVIRYEVQDITGQKATSTLTPIIPPPPVANNDTKSGAYDTNQVIPILTNDTAGSGATLVPTSVKLCPTTLILSLTSSCTLTTLTVPGEGTYTVNPDGTVTFDPLPTFKGTATPVNYVVSDTTGRVDNASITPTVAAPTAPVANPESKSVIPGGTVAFTTLTGTSGLASSGVGLNASVTCLITPASSPEVCDADGVVVIQGEGTYTLNTSTGVVTFAADPAATAGNKTPITYQVQDITGQKMTSTLTPVLPAPPVGTNDTSTGAYDVNQLISPLTNDSATSPATLVASSLKLCATTTTANASCTLTSLTVPNEGTYTVNANGTVTFNPLPTFAGVATPVKYVVADTTGQGTSATITPTVALPAAPVATPESKSVIPGGTVAFTTLTGTNGLASSGVGLNATVTCLITPGSATCDTDGVVEVSGVGTYTLNKATGVVTLVADPNATPGTKASLTYQVTDTFGQTATSTLTPVIPAPPVGTNDTSTGAYDVNQLILPLTNDSATSPATLVASSLKLCATTTTANASCTLTSLTVPNEGTYTVNPDGTVTFNPLPTFAGVATPVKYVVADSTGQVTSATITPTVSAPRVPIAVNDTSTGDYDTNQSINPLLGDTPGEPGLPLLVSSIKICPLSASAPYASTNCALVPTQASPLVTTDGSYWINPTTGIVTFDPSPTFTGTATQPVRYIVQDAMNQTVSATIRPTVTPPPQPVATPQTKLLLPGTTVSFTNVTGAAGLATGTSLQTSGSLATCLYSLNSTMCDADNSVTVIGEGIFVLDPLTGVVTFTADVNATVGTKTSITYQVTDILGRSATSTLTPIIPAETVVLLDTTLDGWDSNQTIRPLTNDTTAPGVTLIASTLKLCADGESASLGTCSLTTLTVPDEGTYTVNPDGTVTFDPLPTFTGTATSVDYEVTDSLGRTAGSTLTPEVAAPGPPVATPEVKVLTPGATATFTNVIGTNALALGAALQTGPTNGPCLIDPTTNLCGVTVTIADEGTWTIDQTTGVVTFVSLTTIEVGTHTPVTYRVTDVLGTTVTSTLTPIIPEVPTVANDEKVSAWDTNQTFSPFANDKFDSNAPVVVSSLKLCGSGESLGSCTRTILSIENEGTYTVNADGTVTFDPLPTFHGTATPVTYQAIDIAGQLLHATITPTVTAPPLPVATTDEISGKKGRSVVFSPWLNDAPGTAPEGFTGTIKLVPSSIRLCGLGQIAPNCTLTKLTTADGKYTVDTKTGKVTFVPRSGFSGLVTQPVTYQISNDWKGPSGVGISSAQLIANIGAGTLPTTGFDFGVVFVIGGLTVGAGVGLWRISTGRKRGKYHLPRWLNEVDGE